MKVVIGGSVSFAKEIKEAKEKLELAGHEAIVTDDLDEYIKDKNIKLNFEQELQLSIKYDIMRSFFNKIAESDGFLVLNYRKRDIEGYLGASVLMEIGLAYYLKKKIFLLNDIDKNQPYALELGIIQPVILNGDLTKIK